MRDEWYVARRGQDGNKRFGPVPLAQLRDLMDDGKVRGEDLVWREGMANWQRADQCDALYPPAPPPRRDYPPDRRGYAGDYGRRDDGPRYDDRPFPRRPPPRSSSSGGVIALVVGLGVVCLLACGGVIFYSLYARPVPTAKSPPKFGVAVPPTPTPVPAPGLAPILNGDYGALCNDNITRGLGQELRPFQDSELFYTANVILADAERLGDYLKGQGVFPADHGVTAQVDRQAAVVQLRFCVQDGMAWDPDAVDYYRSLRSGVWTNVFPRSTVNVQLCDANMIPLRTLGPGD
jgi:hypothetical protein